MTRGLLIVAVLSLWGHASLAQELSIDDEVANVNGESITLGHVIQRFSVLPPEIQARGDDVLWDGLLGMLIDEVLAGQDLTGTDNKRVQYAIDNARRSERAQMALEQHLENAVPDSRVRSIYDERYANEGGREFNAAHILLADEATAQDISNQAKQGSDFNTLAQENSTGPSAPNGGELGWFAEGMMVPSFEAAVKELSVGEISDPVQSPFGWHVIKLNDLRASDAPDYEEASETIRAELERAAAEEYMSVRNREGAITRTRASQTDASKMRMLDLLEQ
ncbi:MAG: peptidylprolyl isomerase [Pseudomonadota bacterium]